MKGRFIFALIFGGLVALVGWLTVSMSSPWSESLQDSILNWLLTPLYLLPYLVMVSLRLQGGHEDLLGTFIVFLEGFVLGLLLYSLFTHFFRKSDVGQVSISDAGGPRPRN